MHPVRDELRRYCDQRLEESARRMVELHVADCEFCEEFCREYRALTEAVSSGDSYSIAPDLPSRADEILNQARSGLIIEFTPSKPAITSEPPTLAADGRSGQPASLENLGTFYSENPEVVLRIMRDNESNREYLQLVSEDVHLISRVLVQVPECNLSILTDQDGRGDIDWKQVEDISKYRWSIKLPDAEFSLSPSQYDPDGVEYHEETLLTTSRGDQLGIQFEGRTEGKRLTLRIIALEGRPEFEPVRVVVSQAAESVSRTITHRDAVELDLTSPDDMIAVRIFAR